MESNPSVLQLLRQATRSAHADIDALLQLGDAAIERQRYQRVMRGFGLFLPRWEAEVRQHLPERLQAWFGARSRLAFLQRDLMTLGETLPQEQAAPSGSFHIDSAAAAFGSMYVMEGSALGGQLIARQAEQHLGLDAEHGAAYFNGWGDRTGTLWREFRERLEQEVGAEPEQRQAACRAAVATFADLHAVFSQLLSTSSSSAG